MVTASMTIPSARMRILLTAVHDALECSLNQSDSMSVEILKRRPYRRLLDENRKSAYTAISRPEMCNRHRSVS